MSRFKVTHVPHFIGGRLRPVGEVLELPEGVKPGRYLEPVADEPRPVERKSVERKPRDLSDA